MKVLLDINDKKAISLISLFRNLKEVEIDILTPAKKKLLAGLKRIEKKRKKL